MSLTILHVEDDKTVAEAVADILCGEGYNVQTCADGTAALALIEGGADYDLIMLDNQLPHVSGLELTQRTRATARHARTPIVMLSASEVGREAKEAGTDSFLRKPEDAGLIVLTVRSLVGREHARAGALPPHARKRRPPVQGPKTLNRRSHNVRGFC